MEFNVFTLPNGIRCIHKQQRSAVVHCALTVNTGSRDELRGEFGMAHFVEHTIFKGTARRKAWQVNCRLENMGGELNAFTTKEETVVHATTLRGDYAKAVELIADIVFASTFPERELEKEKQVIYDEINLYKDSPSERIFDDFEDLIFENSQLGHNILGSKATLRRFSGDDVRAFMNRTYTTDQMVFSLVGNVSEAAFMRTVERYFGCIPASVRGFERQPARRQAQFDKRIGRNTHQVHALCGSQAYDLLSPKRLPLMLLVNTLGGPSANSLLNVTLRERNALSYCADASYTPFSDTGAVYIYFSSEKENADKCIALIDEQLRELMSSPLSARRLAVAKRQFLGQCAISAENAESYMLGAAKSFLVYREVDDFRSVRERVESVDAETLRSVAEEVFGEMSRLVYQ